MFTLYVVTMAKGGITMLMIKKLQFSGDVKEEFQDWVRKNSKKSLLFINDKHMLNKLALALEVSLSPIPYCPDSCDFVDGNNKTHLSFEVISKENGKVVGYLLTNYHNWASNVVYFQPSTLSQISDLFVVY